MMARAGAALPRIPVATGQWRAYRAGVSFRRIFSLLVLFALVLAPAAMLGGAPAMAMDHHQATATSDDGSSTSSHPCSDQQAPSKKASHNCCVMGCVAIPAVGGELAVLTLPTSLRLALPKFWDPHGLAPEADPPPPRFS